MFRVFLFFVAFASIYAQNVPNQDLITKAHFLVNGAIVEPGQFPYHVSLTSATNHSEYHCSGAILSENWVLSSAYCLANYTSVTVHTNTLTDRDGGNAYLADSYIVNEDYVFLENDIALVNLTTTPLIFNENVSSIALPDNEDNLDAELNVTVTGWGFFDPDVPLQYGVATTISNSECGKIFVNIVTDGNICATGYDGFETCFGDSGSPLVANVEKPVVVGTLSFISSLGCEGQPSAYSRVSHYRDWIKEKTGL